MSLDWAAFDVAVTNLSRCVAGWCPACCSRPPSCGAGGNCAPSCSSPWTTEASLYLRTHSCRRRMKKSKNVVILIYIFFKKVQLREEVFSTLKPLKGLVANWRGAAAPSAFRHSSIRPRSMREAAHHPPPLGAPGVVRTGATCSGSKLPGSPPAVQEPLQRL